MLNYQRVVYPWNGHFCMGMIRERSIGTEGTLFSKPHEGMLELPCTAWRAPSPPVQPIGLREFLKPPHLMGKTGKTMVIPWLYHGFLCPFNPVIPCMMTCRSKSNKSKESPHVRHVLWNHWKLLCSRSVLASQCFCDISGAATGPFSPQKSIPGLGRCDEERVLRHPAGSSIGRPAIRQRTGLVKGTHTQKKGLRKKAQRFSMVFYSINLQDSSRFYKYVFQHKWPIVNQSNALRFISNGSGWWLELVGDIPSTNFIVLGWSWLNIYPQLAGQPPSKGWNRVKSHLQVV